VRKLCDQSSGYFWRESDYFSDTPVLSNRPRIGRSILGFYLFYTLRAQLTKRQKKKIEKKRKKSTLDMVPPTSSMNFDFQLPTKCLPKYSVKNIYQIVKDYYWNINTLIFQLLKGWNTLFSQISLLQQQPQEKIFNCQSFSNGIKLGNFPIIGIKLWKCRPNVGNLLWFLCFTFLGKYFPNKNPRLGYRHCAFPI